MKSKLILTSLMALLLSSVAGAKTLYVSQTGSDTFPYTSWGTAASRIQTAVDAAGNGDTVIVGSGTYDSGSTTTPGHLSKNRLVITKNILVRAFSGNPANTIISGTTSGFPINKIKVRCVYMTAGTLRGFTLKNGYAREATGSTIHDQSGGGVNLYQGGRVENCIIHNCTAINNGGGSYEGTLVDCTFTDNIATNFGGGSFSGNLTDCTLSNNSATSGGGLHSGYATDCLLSNNEAEHGGGSHQGTLTGCTLIENRATYGGGNNQGSLTDCTLTGNYASYGGGTRYGTLNHCTLSNNTATNGGGSYQGVLANCTFTENTATSGGGGSNNGTLTDCTLSNNSANYGGGNSGGTLTDCILIENSASHGGGNRSGTLLRCTLADNTAVNQGGGTDGGNLTECTLMNNDGGARGGGGYNTTFSRCILSGNTASKGGGVYGFSSGSSLTNCVIIGNSAIWGGGAYDEVVLHNCTIKGNTAINDGGGCDGGTLYNCIIVDNLSDTNKDGLGDGDDLFGSYSAISSCSPDLTPGINITNAPNFSDTLLHLRADSPCIDSGVMQVFFESDLDGHFRILDGTGDNSAIIDMGAYEYASADVDSDNDGLSNADELLRGTDLNNSDTDGDGRSDGDEVANGFSPTYDETPAIAQGEANVTGDPAAHGLYTATSIQDLNMGLLMLQTSNNVMHLSMQLKVTSDLTSTNWTDAGVAEWQHPVDSGKSFFRVRSE